MYLANTLQASDGMQRIKKCLCVYDFGVKYFSDTNADNILNTL